MKTYVITVSEKFPATHPRSGEPTDFVMKMAISEKIHTIRGNYDLWSKRAEEINKGNALLSVRVWTGKPYRSKQREVLAYEGIGVQAVELTMLGLFVDGTDSDITFHDLAKNDGLDFNDFKDWFKDSWKDTGPKAIIHFSKFRY